VRGSSHSRRGALMAARKKVKGYSLFWRGGEAPMDLLRARSGHGRVHAEVGPCRLEPRTSRSRAGRGVRADEARGRRRAAEARRRRHARRGRAEVAAAPEVRERGEGLADRAGDRRRERKPAAPARPADVRRSPRHRDRRRHSGDPCVDPHAPRQALAPAMRQRRLDVPHDARRREGRRLGEVRREPAQERVGDPRAPGEEEGRASRW
jgi:hypothetical protein